MYAKSFSHARKAFCIAIWMMAYLAAHAADHRVDVENIAFSPAVLQILPGDSVTWTWVSGTHSTTSTASPRLWDSGINSSVGHSFSRTFPDIGSFPYICLVHGQAMTGSVNVIDPNFPPGALRNPIRKSILAGDVAARLVPIVSAGSLNAPLWGTSVPGDTSSPFLYVADQTGILWKVNTGSGEKSAFGDFTARLVSLGIGGPGTYDERGLLGFAFHPSYPTNGLLYTYTSEQVDGAADFSSLPAGSSADHQSVVREWTVHDPADPAAIVDTTGSRELLRIDEPQFNHNGGALNFGTDGKLYVALGDGGNADDQGDGHNPAKGNGQDRSTVLGKILRIDVDLRTSPNGHYGIPPDNPFLPRRPGPRGGAAGCADGKCDEIFAYGLRNPFRFSFDSSTHALYAGDVGQNAIEEIDVIKSGGNYGWRRREGGFCFHPNGDRNGYVTVGSSCSGAGLTGPAAQYDHDEGEAVIGGFVYRGTAIPALSGHYVFGDYSNGSKARVFYLVRGEIVKGRRVSGSAIVELDLSNSLDGQHLLGFAQDAHGELYALTNADGVPSGGSGVIWKISPP